MEENHHKLDAILVIYGKKEIFSKVKFYKHYTNIIQSKKHKPKIIYDLFHIDLIFFDARLDQYIFTIW